MTSFVAQLVLVSQFKIHFQTNKNKINLIFFKILEEVNSKTICCHVIS